ncbi:MAG: PrgI family protein [Patescibacteria group bacterium]
MEQIVVPQFLDVEDKIIGPITVRQFIEMMIGGLLCFIFYKLFDFSLFAVASLLVILVTLVIAFVKINGQPFHYFLLNFFGTVKNPKLKVWRKDVTLADIRALEAKQPVTKPPTVAGTRQILTTSKISELSLIVDTGGVYRGEEKLAIK